MKKIFTFLAGVLISIGMQAVDPITMGQFGSLSCGKLMRAEVLECIGNWMDKMKYVFVGRDVDDFI